MWPGKVHKKRANCHIIWREIFIHLHLPKLYMHPTTVDCDTQDGRNMMWEFVVDQTNSHIVMNRLFCVNKISEYEYKKKQYSQLKYIRKGQSSPFYTPVFKALGYIQGYCDSNTHYCVIFQFFILQQNIEQYVMRVS